MHYSLKHSVFKLRQLAYSDLSDLSDGWTCVAKRDRLLPAALWNSAFGELSPDSLGDSEGPRAGCSEV